jgi:hypothetical protein
LSPLHDQIVYATYLNDSYNQPSTKSFLPGGTCPQQGYSPALIQAINFQILYPFSKDDSMCVTAHEWGKYFRFIRTLAQTFLSNFEYLASISIVILDIEGTTTPISFVADVLFPYARNQLKSHLKRQWGTEELSGDIDALRKLGLDDTAAGHKDAVLIPEPSATNEDDIIEAVCQSVYNQMNVDRKTTALKQLQGHIWDAGYKSGELKGVCV